MKRMIFAGLVTIGAVVAMAFTFKPGNADSTAKRDLPTDPCKKRILYCPDGLAYYTCSKTASIASPDCYNVTTGISNDGCNITEYPCRGRN